MSSVCAALVGNCESVNLCVLSLGPSHVGALEGDPNDLHDELMSFTKPFKPFNNCQVCLSCTHGQTPPT